MIGGKKMLRCCATPNGGSLPGTGYLKGLKVSSLEGNIKGILK
jgi:hypothetical protein